jgi:glycosyltransferase involved in cell wall biosynthesis/uncharacterized protein (DUF2062 family)
LKIAIVIPVFNHAGTVAGVVERVRAVMGAEVAIVVVNDGSTDGTGAVVKALSGVTVLEHAKNRGKGAALLTAFQHALAAGFTHALTIDADAQHDPRDIPRLVEVAREHAEDLVIGWRDMEKPAAPLGGAEPVKGAVPAMSKRGRDASRYWLRVQTGQDIPDSQCGLRVYPLSHVLGPPYRFRRFDFETEVLARMAWGGVKIRSVPVRCIYFPKGQRVSHFRPVMDTLRGIWVNTFLVGRRLFPMPFPQLVAREDETAKFDQWWKWSAWKKAARDAMRAGTSNSELASAVAVGVFVGLTPIFCFQTILAIYLARRLHLNVLAAVLGSQISIPPVVPFWYFLSYSTGYFVLHGQWVTLDSKVFTQQMLPTFLLGTLIVAVVVSLASLFVMRWVLYYMRPSHRSARHLGALSAVRAEP